SHRTRAALEAHTGVPVGLAMRYGSPSIAGGIDALLERAGTVDDLTVVAMYPQYAMASTMTVEVAVEKELRARGVPHRFIPPFFADDGYLDALAALAREHLPGDVHQVFATTHGVAQRLGLSRDQYAVSFQSRLGGGWLQPFTDVVLAELPARGVERIAVVCPSFVADCLETLEEISIRGRASFLAAGGKAFAYLPCLNDDPRWIAALAKLCDAPSAVQR